MLEQTFHTPLPLELEVGIPSGDIEVETAEGEESNITVDGDERLLEEVEIRQDGNRLVVAYRGKGEVRLLALPALARVRRASCACGPASRTARTSRSRPPRRTRGSTGSFGPVGVNSVSGDLRVRGEIAGNASIKTVSGDADLERVDGDMSAQTVSGDLRIGPVAGSADTKTVSGDIRFQSVTAGDVRFTSVSGDVEIGIAHGSAVDVDAGSTSGDLSSEVPLGERALAGRGRPGSDGRPPRSHRQRRREGLPGRLMQDGVAVVRAPILRSRPLVALLVAEVLSTTGSQMTWLALPWFVLVTSGSKQMALVIAAEAGGYALFGIPSGSLLERLGPQRTMRLCDAVRAPLMVLVPVLHWSGGLTLPILIVIAFLLGVAGTPYGAAQRIVVAEILDEDEASVERANALLQGATRITMLAGPALAGILIAAVGAPVVLLVDAASYVVSFLLVTLFVPVARAVRVDSEDGQGLLAGVRYLLRDPLLRGWTAAVVVGDASFSVLFVAIPVLVVHHYGADPRLAGAFLASWGVGCVAGNLVAYRSDRVGGLRQAVPLVLVQALPLWALAAPVPSGADRGGPPPVRDRQRARQPHPARLPHPAPAGRRACEGPNRALHGVVARDTGRARRGGARVPGLRLPGRRRGRGRRPARGHELRSRDHAPLPGSGARLMRTLLSYRDARLLLAGQTLSSFGDWAMLIVLAVWMKSLTGSSALAGLTFFTFAAGSLLAPLGGLLADRARRRPLMIVSDCVLGAFVLVLLLVHDRSNAWLIYAVAFAYGALGTVFYPARAALLKIMLPEELLAEANGALTATREGLRVVAPLAGAGLYALLGGGAVADRPIARRPGGRRGGGGRRPARPPRGGRRGEPCAAPGPGASERGARDRRRRGDGGRLRRP